MPEESPGNRAGFYPPGSGLRREADPPGLCESGSRAATRGLGLREQLADLAEQDDAAALAAQAFDPLQLLVDSVVVHQPATLGPETTRRCDTFAPDFDALRANSSPRGRYAGPCTPRRRPASRRRGPARGGRGVEEAEDDPEEEPRRESQAAAALPSGSGSSRRDGAACDRQRTGTKAEQHLVERGDEARAVSRGAAPRRARGGRPPRRGRRGRRRRGAPAARSAARCARGRSPRGARRRASRPPRRLRRRRAAIRALRAIRPRGPEPVWKSASSQRSSASSASGSAPAARRSTRPETSWARNGSSRVGSPVGDLCGERRRGANVVRAPSSRSKMTGPAAIAPEVARRRAVMARPNSAGASGTTARGAGKIGGQLEDERAVDLAAEVARKQPLRLGPDAVSSPPSAGRTRSPEPSSIVPPADRPTSGATRRRRAWRRRASARAPRRRARSPRRPSRTRRRPRPCGRGAGSRRCGAGRRPRRMRSPAWARAKIPAAGSSRRATSASCASSRREMPVGARLDEGADERAVLVERRPVRRGVLGEGDRNVGSGLDLGAQLEERAEAERAQRAMERRRARDGRCHEGTRYASAQAPSCLTPGRNGAPMGSCAGSPSPFSSPQRSPPSCPARCRREARNAPR